MYTISLRIFNILSNFCNLCHGYIVVYSGRINKILLLLHDGPPVSRNVAMVIRLETQWKKEYKHYKDPATERLVNHLHDSVRVLQ